MHFLNNCPRGGVLARFICARVRGAGFHTFFVPGGGEFALSKRFPGRLPGGGGWPGLELPNTLTGPPGVIQQPGRRANSLRCICIVLHCFGSHPAVER